MTSTLRISRQQLSKFLGNDYDAIRQFETLFNTVATPTTATATEPEIQIETAGHEALARIERLERAFHMLELAPAVQAQAAPVSSVLWGGITGTISDQTDLAAAMAYGVDPVITTSDSWDDDFTSYDTSKWTTFNSPTDVVSTDGELVVTSSQSTVNTYQGVRCNPPSTSEGYTIVCASRLLTTTNQLGNYHCAGIGFVVGTTLHMTPVYMNMTQIDYWYGNWNGGVPQYSGSIGLSDYQYSNRRILKLVVTSTSVELWSWTRNNWVLLKTITTTALPTYIVLGVKHHSSSAYKTQGYFEWIKRTA